MDQDKLKEVEAQTQEVYEKTSLEYDKERGRSLFEKKYLDQFIKELPTGKVLDLGCGSGEPIAKYLIEQGLEIEGADYSKSMLSLCQRRFPDHRWFYCDMRDLNIKGEYAGILSWGALFHLNQEEQRQSLPKICERLLSKGVLLITVGHEEGEVLGQVAGREVYHSSLSPEEYRWILKENHVDIIEFNLQDPQCQGFSVLLGRKR